MAASHGRARRARHLLTGRRTPPRQGRDWPAHDRHLEAPCADGGIIITPSVEDALALRGRADLIAADGDDRPRPAAFRPCVIRRIVDEVVLPFMADCATLEQAQRAQDAGAAIAATTRAHPPHLGPYEPDLDVLAAMVRALSIPVIAEGRFWDPDDVRRAFDLGALAVVIGSAVTRPWHITERFVGASPSGRGA